MAKKTETCLSSHPCNDAPTFSGRFMQYTASSVGARCVKPVMQLTF